MSQVQPNVEQPFLKAVSALLELEGVSNQDLVEAFSKIPQEKLEDLKIGIPKLLNLINEIQKDKQEQAEEDRIFYD